VNAEGAPEETPVDQPRRKLAAEDDAVRVAEMQANAKAAGMTHISECVEAEAERLAELFEAGE
jgi:hypothetical protein